MQPSAGFEILQATRTMRPELMEYLACPMDRESPLKLEVLRTSRDGDVLEGVIRCPSCARTYPIRESIPSFVSQPDTGSGDEEVNRWKAEEQLLGTIAVLLTPLCRRNQWA
jgi:uncharacterized protein YbaR (Trm112 family)